ncbi:hypothetical protein M405DRAFT_870119 [Rhizopogon salebrosus TDB-379]|nr:hypothetical protein M405DRAFT_870119 [Rhizopogon salebrosus TDB-379]
MESAISGTRSDDATRLKTHFGRYVAPNPAEAIVSPLIHDGSSRRTHMGINHPVFSVRPPLDNIFDDDGPLTEEEEEVAQPAEHANDRGAQPKNPTVEYQGNKGY